MEFNYFDLVVSIIVLLLGLKGIINGFFKELFGLIGIIGGIFIASRLDDTVGKAINDALFKFESEAAVTFTGFLVTLGVFWLAMIAIGMMFKKMVAVSGLGIFDRILGFVFGSGKFFLIGSVIVYAVFNIKVINDNLGKSLDNSFMFAAMKSTGSFIMKLDPVEAVSDMNESIDETIEEAKIQIEKKAMEMNATDAILGKTTEAFKQEVMEQIESNSTSKAGE
jgi:membrane protein required for colicin V production